MFRHFTKRISYLSAAAIGCSGGYLFFYSRKASVVAASSPFNYQVTREVRRENGDFLGSKLTLFQYYSCPFCCKVRAYLDLRGINYDIVEVNSVFRGEVSWSEYKKVPIVVVSDKDGKKSDYLQVISQRNYSFLIRILSFFKKFSSFVRFMISFAYRSGFVINCLTDFVFLCYFSDQRFFDYHQRSWVALAWHKDGPENFADLLSHDGDDGSAIWENENGMSESTCDHVRPVDG